MMARISCRDRYEAQKLSGLVYTSEGQTLVKKILDVIGGEVVFSLDDASAHSVVLGDEEVAGILTDFMQSVLEGEHRITGLARSGSTVEITKG